MIERRLYNRCDLGEGKGVIRLTYKSSRAELHMLYNQQKKKGFHPSSFLILYNYLPNQTSYPHNSYNKQSFSGLALLWLSSHRNCTA